MSHEPTPSDHAGAPSKELAGLRLVVAEDNWLIADGLKSVLERNGATVAGMAYTVAELRSIVAETAPEAVIADLDLRGETAAPFLEELARGGMPLVVITGYPDAPGIDGYGRAILLRKPVSAARLIAALSRVCASGGA